MSHIWLSLALVLYGSAQTTPTARIPSVLSTAVKQLEPAAAPDAWVLQVLTRGGLDGRGTGDVFINSSGGAGMSRVDQRERSWDDLFVPQLEQSLRAIVPSQWTSSTSPGICSDCVVTLMHLAVGSTNGSVQTYSVS